MTILRRFLVLQMLMLWQGGFLFYASFVVPTGTEVLGSTEAQGSITARVTDYLNLCGVAGLVLFAWELLVSRTRKRRSLCEGLSRPSLARPANKTELIRWLCWITAAVCQVVLFILHEKLEAMMDPTLSFVLKRQAFYRMHGVYLWTSTVQWAACLLLLWFTLRAWRDSHSGSGTMIAPVGSPPG